MLVKGSLYVVATPIGNLRDISLRALDVLAAVDMVAAEHVYTAKHLLAAHSISAKVMLLHQHNELAVTERIISLLTANKIVALITDAGTPCISDPGAVLVNRVRMQGFQVIPIPGANAAICALSASGITTPCFLFYGFLPSKTTWRKHVLGNLKILPYTLIFYEAPHRILDCIDDLIEVFGPHRQITIARELTKVFETIHVCSLGDVPEWLQSDSNRQKGEFVLLVAGAIVEEKPEVSENDLGTLDVLLSSLPLKQAVELAVRITGKSRKKLYSLALKMKADE